MKNLIFMVFCALLPLLSLGQSTDFTSDELFEQARTAAFDKKDYPKAIALSKKALMLSPNYTDISIFLGRIYTWSDHIDSAKLIFEGLRQRQIKDADFYLAYSSLLYWNETAESANTIVNEGLSHQPKSEDLWYLKARINYSADQYDEAESAINQLLKLNSKHAEAISLAQSIREYTTKNAIGLTYYFTHFDKQFSDNWHILSMSYKRATALGSVIFKTNYANKFGDNGVQFELEAYPRINKMFYMYVGTGYSNDVGLFPKFRTGASLYANLPASFEGELGFRQLHFSNNIWMYTASVGKYYKNLWFNLRTYLTPGESNISHSYTGTLRYYTKGANDYLAFMAGTGISPEEFRSNLLEINTFKLKTYKIGVDYNFSVNQFNQFSVSGTYFNQEYRPSQKGNQYDLTLSYKRVF